MNKIFHEQLGENRPRVDVRMKFDLVTPMKILFMCLHFLARILVSLSRMRWPRRLHDRTHKHNVQTYAAVKTSNPVTQHSLFFLNILYPSTYKLLFCCYNNVYEYHITISSGIYPFKMKVLRYSRSTLCGCNSLSNSLQLCRFTCANQTLTTLQVQLLS